MTDGKSDILVRLANALRWKIRKACMREWLMPQRFADVVHRLVRQPSKLDRWVRLPSSAYITECGSVWLERLVWDQDVAGSNPVIPIRSIS